MQEVKILEEEPLKIALSGEIDSENAGDITFDCSALEFIDSTTLGTFVKILKQVKTGGGTLKLTALCPRLKKLFVICALDKIMEIAA